MHLCSNFQCFCVCSLSPHRHVHHKDTKTPTQPNPTDEGSDEISPVVSDQSAIERAVHNITTSGIKREERERELTFQTVSTIDINFNLVNGVRTYLS